MNPASNSTLIRKDTASIAGYMHPWYADSFAGLGTPRALAGSGGWLIERPVPRDPARDAMGCYPLFVCRDWGALGEDLKELAGELVAVSLVTDPLGEFTESQLKESFVDLCRPFKEHFAINFAQSLHVSSSSHRRNIRLAAREVEVEHVADPPSRADDWITLYQVLIERHAIRGIPAFRPETLARQLAVPGITMLRAVRRGQTVGITLWYDDGVVAYYHLGAYSEVGYATRASYALFDRAIAKFRERVHWVLLGAGAGATGTAGDGLTRFKQGWSNATRTAWLCGRILDRDRYCTLSTRAGPAQSHYFPAYRAGEFS